MYRKYLSSEVESFFIVEGKLNIKVGIDKEFIDYEFFI